MNQCIQALNLLICCCMVTGNGSHYPLLTSLARTGREPRLHLPTMQQRRSLHEDHLGERFQAHAKGEEENSHHFICSINGGLDVVRLSSYVTRVAFKSALEDVELIRQYIVEAALNNDENLNTGLDQGSDQLVATVGMTLEELSETLDAQARKITSPNATTLTAGLGYTDDRKGRHIERYVSLANEPIVGTKQTDLDLIEPVADIFPWIVDRTTFTGKNAILGEQGERLYAAAWIGTYGEAWMYYPALHNIYGHPFGFGDILGDSYDSKKEEFVKPNLPPKYIENAYFTPPYQDTAIPGLSLITAQAPIYLTGSFQGYEYNQTYIASTGVDISVARMATFLDDLEGTVTHGSFAIVVTFDGFQTILISQSTVDKVYPEYTGMEETRVTYDAADGSIIVDRRNKPYKVSDTIFQPLTNLSNSHSWKVLETDVQALRPGERSYTLINVKLTGDESETPFYVIYERWDEVADWVLLLFVPQEEVDSSIALEMVQPKAGEDLHIEVFVENAEDNNNNKDNEARLLSSFPTVFETAIRNTGFLSVTLSITKLPAWLEVLDSDSLQPVDPEAIEDLVIQPGRNLTLTYGLVLAKLPGGKVRSTSSILAFTIKDNDYSNCFYKQVLTTNVFVDVYHEPELNQLGMLRVYGFVLCAVVTASAFGWSAWVFLHSSHRVVKASQPIFLQMMCAGIFVMGLSLIPLSIDDSLASVKGCSIACMAFPWFISVGFSITFSALFSKVWRLNQIVSGAKNHKRVRVSTRDVMVPFLVICTLNVFILTIWSGLDPLIWEREPTKEASGAKNGSIGSEDTYGYCSLHESALDWTCFVLLILVNFSALVMALIQLYRARELSMEYCEGKCIAIAMGSMIQVFLTGVPILVIVTDNPRVSYFVKSTIVFTLAMSLLLLTFLPKLYIATSDTQSAACSQHSTNGSVSGTQLKFNRVKEEHVAQPVNDEAEHQDLQKKSVASADDSKDGGDCWKQGVHLSVRVAPSDFRCHNDFSDISMSMMTSDTEAQGQSVHCASRVQQVEVSMSAPKIPVRLPSVAEDIAGESDRWGQSKEKDEVRQAIIKSLLDAPHIPVRFPSAIDDAIDVSETLEYCIYKGDTREDTMEVSRLFSVNEESAYEYDIESEEIENQFESVHIPSESPAPSFISQNEPCNRDQSITKGVVFCKQDAINNTSVNATVPRRLPSLADVNHDDDEGNVQHV